MKLSAYHIHKIKKTVKDDKKLTVQIEEICQKMKKDQKFK